MHYKESMATIFNTMNNAVRFGSALKARRSAIRIWYHRNCEDCFVARWMSNQNSSERLLRAEPVQQLLLLYRM